MHTASGGCYWPKRRRGTSNSNDEARRMNLFVIWTHCGEGLQSLLAVELEISQRLICRSFLWV
jgi:hypothetical protein